MFTYRWWLRRRLQTRPVALLGPVDFWCRSMRCLATGQTAACYVGTWCRRAFLFVVIFCCPVMAQFVDIVNYFLHNMSTSLIIFCCPVMAQFVDIVNYFHVVLYCAWRCTIHVLVHELSCFCMLQYLQMSKDVQFQSVAEVDDFAESTNSSLNYLILEASGIKKYCSLPTEVFAARLLVINCNCCSCLSS